VADERVIRALIRFGLDKAAAQAAAEEIKKFKKPLKDSEEAAKELEEALKLVGKSGKHSIKEVDAETVKLEKALKLLGKSGKFEIKEVDGQAKGFGATMGKLQVAAAALTAIFAAGKIVSFFKSIAAAAVGANKEFEVYRAQFETLLGSTTAAQQRLEELARFGVETPFELPEIVEASRQLQVFGGTALATGDNLRMVGDIAAGVNQPFAEVATWVGRMYDAVQNGQPFGEAAQRLQEMGALSGDARRKLESMQKAGEDSNKIFAVFSDEVGGRFAGNMERLSGTLQGIISNLIDFQQNLLRVGGEPYFEQVKGDAKELLDIVSDPEMMTALENLAGALAGAAAQAQALATSPLLESLAGVEPETIQDLADALQDAADALSEFLGQDYDADLNSLIKLLTTVVDTITFFTNAANRLKSTLEPIAPIIDALKRVFLGMVAPITTVIEGFKALNDLAEQLTGKGLVDFSRAAADASQTEAQEQKKLAEAHLELAQARQDSAAAAAAATQATEDSTEAVEDAIDATEEYEAALGKINDKMEDLATDVARKREDIMQDHERDLADLSEQGEEERLDIMIEAERKRLDAAEEFARKRVDAATENLRRIEDIERKHNQDLAAAGTELSRTEQDIARKFSQQQIDLAKQSAQKKQDIETEHLRRIRDIRTQFEYAAEEAVRNQDAIGFLRSQRDRDRQLQAAGQDRQDKQADEATEIQRSQEQQREQQQRELEEARLANQRKVEDLRARLAQELEENRLKLERELADISLAEDRKRADSQKALERELEDQRKSEERKRADLQKNLEQRLQDLAQAEDRRKADLGKSLAAELEIVKKYEADRTKIQVQAAQDRAAQLAQYEQQNGPATPDNPNYPAGPRAGQTPYSGGSSAGGSSRTGTRFRRRASGGYADPGLYNLGEAGQEFVLNNATTRAAETALGGALSQGGLLASLLGGGGLGGSTSQASTLNYGPTYNFSERDDTQLIMDQIESRIDEKLLRLTRGY
jgi:hypothetical protein